ncbi:MAG TPA: DUF2231 domain-containing protein [Sphingomicrobium sp.]|nr:DUF2231 domain-containing protein [Sphingomicrobium sp.]
MTETSRPVRPRPLLHPHFVGAGAALLIAALVTDLLYWRSLLSAWETFSIWLLTGGLILALLAGIALLFDVLTGRVRQIRWLHFGVLGAAVLISILNAFIHSRDGYTAVVWQGLLLSTIAAILLLVIGWHGWSVAEARPFQSAPSEGIRT